MYHFISPTLLFREQLVSTIDAEHALRDQKLEIPILRARGPRDSGIITSLGRGKPFIFDPVALKVPHARSKLSTTLVIVMVLWQERSTLHQEYYVDFA